MITVTTENGSRQDQSITLSAVTQPKDKSKIKANI
jgi:hypothetical protein